MEVSDFDFELPQASIAQRPLPRGTARLMTLDRATGAIAHRHVPDLPELLCAGDLLVLNDTRVIPARLVGRDENGRRVELLLVEKTSSNGAELWRCLAKPGRRVKPHRRFSFGGGWEAEVAPASGAEPGLYLMHFEKRGNDPSSASLLAELPALGSAPLPPYIHRPGGIADAEDAATYQTVYAREPGAIAAPTAGLHLTPDLLARIEARGVTVAAVTLHVGIGTFKPVKASRVEEHVMDAERAEIPETTAAAVDAARAAGRRVVAVGTTSVRTLEASARAHGGRVAAGAFRTDLFLVPGSPFLVVDALLTNFHLPRSTLLMLVSAFAGRERVLAAYREAVASGYRFFSYGDAMFVS